MTHIATTSDPNLAHKIQRDTPGSMIQIDNINKVFHIYTLQTIPPNVKIVKPKNGTIPKKPARTGPNLHDFVIYGAMILAAAIIAILKLLKY